MRTIGFINFLLKNENLLLFIKKNKMLYITLQHFYFIVLYSNKGDVLWKLG